MLNREARFAAIALADADRLELVADGILVTEEVTVLRSPTGGTLMMRAIETAAGTVFNLGEVAVTEAEVLIRGERGYAMVQGFAPKHALAGAIIDAAAAAGVGDTEQIERVLEEAIDRKAEQDLADWRAVAPTRVSFDEIPQ